MKQLLLTTLLFACYTSLNGQDIKEALFRGNLEDVKTFLKDGNDINQQHIGGRYTLLCAAVKLGDEDITNYLLKKGADTEIMSNGKTPLMYAAKYGKLEIAKILIKKGADKDFKSPKGVTALNYAEKYEHPPLVEYLEGL